MTTKCTVLSQCWADTLPAPLGKQEGLGRPAAPEGALPDVQGPLLAGSEGPRPGAHAAVHHLFSQVMYLGFKTTVLCREDKGKDGERMKPSGTAPACRWPQSRRPLGL